jgi:hypothetical protein
MVNPPIAPNSLQLPLLFLKAALRAAACGGRPRPPNPRPRAHPHQRTPDRTSRRPLLLDDYLDGEDRPRAMCAAPGNPAPSHGPANA